MHNNHQVRTRPLNELCLLPLRTLISALAKQNFSFFSLKFSLKRKKSDFGMTEIGIYRSS